MVYLFNKTLKNDKNFFFQLVTIKGLGVSLTKYLFKKNHLNLKIKCSANILGELFLKKKLISMIEKKNILLSVDLERKNRLDVESLISVNSYKGYRHILGLPVNGQRTHTNSRTIRRMNFFILNYKS